MTEEQKTQIKINELETELKRVSDILTGRSTNIQFADFIRDVVFFDQDVSSGLTNSTNYNVSGGAGGTVNSVITPKVPTKYLKGYFRGQVILIPIFIPPIS